MYWFFKYLFSLSFRLFYRKIRIYGKDKLLEKGPLLVVGNHPNTLIDPLIIGIHMKQKAGFVGKATLFENRILGWLFPKFDVIPVYRTHDYAEGQRPDNKQAFEAVNVYLRKSGTILIFPEGTSYSEMKLRKIKTGTARMAFEYEEMYGFEGGLMVQPVSINYFNPSVFYSDVTLLVNDPIRVADFADLYREDKVAAVQALSDRIREGLEATMVILDDKEQELLMTRVKRLYFKRLLESNEIAKTSREAFEVLRNIGKAIRIYHDKHPEKYKRIKLKIDNYFKYLDRLDLWSGVISDRLLGLRPEALSVLYTLYLIPTFPIWLFGTVTNYLPYILPAWLAPKISHEVEFWATIKILFAILFFPLFYAGEILAFHFLTPFEGIWTLIFGLALPLSGFFALHWGRIFRRNIALIKLRRYFRRKGSLIEALRARKLEIIKELDEITDEILGKS